MAAQSAEALRAEDTQDDEPTERCGALAASARAMTGILPRDRQVSETGAHCVTTTASYERRDTGKISIGKVREQADWD